MPKRPAKRSPANTTRRKPSRVPPSADALNPRERRFAEEYLVDLNGKQAAIRAGYAPRSAEVTASRLLRKPKVKALVDAGMDERSARTEVNQDRVIHETALLAFSDLTHYVLDDDGQVQLAEGAPPDAMRALSSIKRRVRTHTYADGTETVTKDVEVKLWNKPEPLKLAGRHVGLFPNEVKVDMGEETLAGILSMAHDLLDEDRRSS